VQKFHGLEEIHERRVRKMLVKILCFTIIGLVMLLQSTLGWALYFDFEDDAQLKQWEIQGTWKIEKDKNSGSKALAGEGAGEVIALVGEVNWADYTVEFEASGQTDEIAVAFRAQDANNFLSFMVAPSLNLSEWFQKLGGQFDENIAAKGDKLGIATQEWHKYKLVVEGNKASIFADDKEAIKALQLDKLPDVFKNGRIGFRQWADSAHYDNVLITGPGIPRTPGEPGAAVNHAAKLATTWASLKK
jgi:hypothetical protein